jgi:metallo-beta-lactamase family protein
MVDNRPWLPDDPDEPFDPLDHADLEVGPEHPMVVTPRGGAREVGRSCYQLDTEHATYLVDCGLNQGDGDPYPDFRGLTAGDVDGVFLTHAHVDHSGGLPVLAARGYLDDDATIVATPPTIEIATLLLQDSLKIHRHEAQQRGESQVFTRADVDDVIERFQPVGYGGGKVEGVTAAPGSEPLVFQVGDAAHLLGSAWVAFQTAGYRVVFSGDLGGRAPHLSQIQPAPQADLLLLESTYGGKHSHKNISDAQTDFFETVIRAVEDGHPVLVPTFSVGRAQLLALTLKDRLHTVRDDVLERVQVVVDGMAQDGTEIYHHFASDDEFVDESLVNRVTESGVEEPFRADQTTAPDSDDQRADVLSLASGSGSTVPVVLAPSGMLTGGHSPRYLVEFAARYDTARVILTGYQAVDTGGRQLQNQLKAGKSTLTFETDADPFGTTWPASDDVEWISVTDDSGRTRRLTRASIPADWIHGADGLSGHAAQAGLRNFTKTTEASTVALVHGPEYAQSELATDLAKNIDHVEEVTRARLLTPIPVTRDLDLDTASITTEMLDAEENTLGDQVEHLYEQLAALNEEVAAARHPIDEETIREIVREELRALVDDEAIEESTDDESD